MSAMDQHQKQHEIQCHYDVLSVARDADASTIKKAHRKLALQFHPDKNIGNKDAAAQFRLVQQAYECLSDPAERKWYNEHREAMLKGWSASGGGGGGGHVSILFDVVPYQYAGCYNGYGSSSNSDDDDRGSFFAVYRMVFRKVYEGEEQGWTSEGNTHDEFPLAFLSIDFGNADSEWDKVAAFYKSWESFTSCLGFAWADVHDPKEAPDRRVRRAMEDENKRARRKARKERNEDVLALVHFCKRRDPRVKARQEKVEQDSRRREIEKKREAERKKAQAAQARESWKIEQEQAMADFEEKDRIAGRVRLADLDDDYDYGGNRRGKKGKKKSKARAVAVSEEEESEQQSEDNNEEGETETASHQGGESNTSQLESGTKSRTALDEVVDTDSDGISEQDISSEEESSESEPDVWRCECCRKDFKSHGQMENHMNSKKHKVAFKKFQAKRNKEAEMEELIDTLVLDP